MKLRIRNWVYQLVFCAALIVVVILTLGVLRNQDVKLQAILARTEALNTEKHDAELQLEGMQRLLEYANSDAHIEQAARQIFGWVRPDEYLFVDGNVEGAASPDKVVEAQNAYREAAELERSVEAEALGIQETATPMPTETTDIEAAERTDFGDDEAVEAFAQEQPAPEPEPEPTPEPQKKAAKAPADDFDSIANAFGIPEE